MDIRFAESKSGSKEHYLLGQKHNLQIFKVIPASAAKLQNNT